MKLRYDDDLEAFRREYRAFLDAHKPTDEEIAAEPPRSSGHLPDWARRWQRTQFDAGWLVPGWPAELGGREASPAQVMVCFEELGDAYVSRTPNVQGLATVGPSIVEHGTKEQIERYAVPLLRGEKSACIGMSEPNAGSDLAGLSTSARLDGDGFVINGQKVWTSGAQDANFCLLLARTDPEASKHAGISVFILDLDLAGVQVRPLEMSIGQHHADVNEVFLDDVHVSSDALLGELNDGWRIANSSLAHERMAIWIMDAARNRRILSNAVDHFKVGTSEGRPLVDDDALVDRLVGLAIDVHAFVTIGYKGYARASRGLAAPEHSLLKVYGSETRQALELLMTDAAGPGAVQLLGEGPSIESWVDGIETPFLRYLRSFDDTISGGTSEIQRNIIAERSLGLPRR